MKKFILTLGKTDTINLVFDVFTSNIAKKWADEVSKNYSLYETTRFVGFDKKEISFYIQKIEEQLLIINEYASVKIKMPKKLDQQSLNILHKHFEDMRGEINIGTQFYNSAPSAVQSAVNYLNILIHECENDIQNSKQQICGTYQSRPRLPLTEEDYEQFTFKWQFGYVYISYCEVGKPLLDVFDDNDTNVSDANVRPQNYYSADWALDLSPSIPIKTYNYRLAKFNEWYQTYHLKFNKLSLGMIPVAAINLNESNIDSNLLVDTIRNYQYINSTQIKDSV